MNIVGTCIRTPLDLDSMLEYDYDWMHQVAKRLSDVPEAMIDMPDEIRNNGYIQSHASFLEEYRRIDDDRNLTPEFRAHRLVMAWSDSGNVNHARTYIEALLLTGADFGTITKIMAGDRFPPEVTQLYERLYFNVREDSGRLGIAAFPRMRAALPNNGQIDERSPQDVVWRAVAMRFGFAGLATVWHLPEDVAGVVDPDVIVDETWREGQGIQIDNLIRRRINNFDLNLTVGQYVDYKRLKHDTGGTKANAAEEALYAIIQRFRPQMLVAAKTVDDRAAETAKLQSRLAAQSNVSGQLVADTGVEAGLSAIKDRIDQTFGKMG